METRERLVAGDEVLFTLIAGLILYFSKVSVLHLPYLGEELLSLVQPTRQLYEQGLGNLILEGNFFQPGRFFSKPFGFSLIFYPVLKVFGHSFFLMRILALFFVCLSLLFTYKLGKLVKGKILGLCAAVALLALPSFFTQSPFLLSDVLFTALSALFFFWLLQGRSFWGLLILGLLMGFSHEQAILYSIVAICFYLIRRDLSLKSLWIVLGPLWGWAFFLFVNRGGRFGPSFSETSFIESFRYLTLSDFHDVFLYPAFFFALVILVFPRLREKKGMTAENLFFLFLPLVLSFLFLSFSPKLRTHSFYPVLPFFMLLCFYPLVRFSRILALLFLVVISIRLPAYAFQKTPFEIGVKSQTAMSYRDIVTVQKEAAQYLTQHYATKRIFTNWPLDTFLKDPFYGFVGVPLAIATSEDGQKGLFDVFVWSNQAQESFSSLIQRDLWIKNQNLRLVESFSSHNAWIEIYTK